jgi:hypothetical protein
MARPERYFVGPNKRNEINEVISLVKGTPMKENGAEVPTRLQGMPSPPGRVKLGKTTAAWNKNTLATIELFEEGTPPSEGKKTPADTLENCVNKFANVATGKWVIVARGGNGYWYLIAAECSEA